MLTVGPSQYDRPDSPCWWVVVNGTMVASLSSDSAGRWWAHLNLHYATRDRWEPRFPGKRVQHVELDSFNTERLARWAEVNRARLEHECPPPLPKPPPPDL